MSNSWMLTSTIRHVRATVATLARHSAAAPDADDAPRLRRYGTRLVAAVARTAPVAAGSGRQASW